MSVSQLQANLERPSAYIPMDRRQALLRGEEIPNRASGSALFADISGFTPLTERLVQDLGAQRGAEELTRYLNLVYDALIEELHMHGGSVISFSGDAITCWLESDNGLRATACALAMQAAMKQFAAIETPSGFVVSMQMKTAVATGTIRRFVVGEPTVQKIDVLAGSLLDRLVMAEHLAQRGDVVLDEATVTVLGERVEIREWRVDEQSGLRFAVITAVEHPTIPTYWPKITPGSFPDELVAEWLLPPVYHRLREGRGEFLAELRPAVSLFLRFGGIDYDGDESAGEKLDAFVKRVQNVLAQYESYLLQLTIGDKGSYLCAAFGAPYAHEDDALRAVSVALELRALVHSFDFITSIQIGISHGRMRTGAYGGNMRRTYGVLGDEVNVAARFMQAAAAGQILVSEAVQRMSANTFGWEALPPLVLKGKSGAVPVYSLLGRQEQRTVRLQEPQYALPMVGRESELASLEDRIEMALHGQGQIIRLAGEAGIGKSRLVAELIRVATERGMVGFGGECQSYGTKTSYLVWQRVLRAFFDLDPKWSTEVQIRALDQQLRTIEPSLSARLPLLGPVLQLPIPDNELTQSFDAKLRKTSLEALLTEVVRVKTQYMPTLFVIEDAHWIDPLSRDLLEVVARATVDRPVLILLAARLPDTLEQRLNLSQFANFSELMLTEFTPAEAEQLISLKLSQLFGQMGRAPSALVQRIVERASGNPFYIEELLNYLQVQGLDAGDMRVLAQLELPASLHSLILSRIDQLSESQKSTLKVASVIGRLFKAAMVWGVYPLGGEDRVKIDLERLSQLDLTPLDTPAPELTYLFKSVITQEVAYESLPYATRSRLHGLIGDYIEENHSGALEQSIDLLAYHYELSENERKKKKYLLQAGELAQAKYANEAAVAYYQRVLPLLSRAEQIPVKRKLGKVLETVGQWDDAADEYEEALALAQQLEDRQEQAWSEATKAELLRKQGQFTDAAQWLERARDHFRAVDNQEGLGQVFHISGTVNAQQGSFDEARSLYAQSLSIRRQLDDKRNIASLLSNLGIITRARGQHDESIAYHEEALAIRRELGDRWAIANSLNNLGNVLLDSMRDEDARKCLEEAVKILREVGDPWAIANSLNNLGNVVRDQGDFATAKMLYNESLRINRDFEDKWALAYLLEDMGNLAVAQEQYARAHWLISAAAVLREEIGSPHSAVESKKMLALVEPIYNVLDEGERHRIKEEAAAQPLEAVVNYALGN